LRKRKNDSVRFDRADAVVRVPIAGLNDEAAQRALKRANREAVRLLEAPIRAKRLRYPITLTMVDGAGLSVAELTTVRPQAGPAAVLGFLFYLVAEDTQGRCAYARIELVQQVIH
jgi:hypothetical protein